MECFKGKQFKKDIIWVAVGYDFRFSLSYRNVSELLGKHGISIHPTTIVRWVHKYDSLILSNLEEEKQNCTPCLAFG